MGVEGRLGEGADVWVRARDVVDAKGRVGGGAVLAAGESVTRTTWVAGEAGVDELARGAGGAAGAAVAEVAVVVSMILVAGVSRRIGERSEENGGDTFLGEVGGVVAVAAVATGRESETGGSNSTDEVEGETGTGASVEEIGTTGVGLGVVGVEELDIARVLMLSGIWGAAEIGTAEEEPLASREPAKTDCEGALENPVLGIRLRELSSQPTARGVALLTLESG
jgi:hypothetical protein